MTRHTFPRGHAGLGLDTLDKVVRFEASNVRGTCMGNAALRPREQ